jgi:GAF domain-containing protein
VHQGGAETLTTGAPLPLKSGGNMPLNVDVPDSPVSRSSMLSAPIPDNDEERLAALHALLILDTPPDQRFDRIVEFAAHEFEVPIALISLVDRDRQWFKSRFGLTACELPRSTSFCGHAILQPGLLIVPDARVDERFVDNPLVTGEPFIRFYAGMPLILPSGHAVGTLCLLDRRMRRFDHIDQAILTTLTELVIKELTEPDGMHQERQP